MYRDSDLVTGQFVVQESFMLSGLTAVRSKLCVEGQFVGECIMPCPEQVHERKTICLSRHEVDERTNDVTNKFFNVLRCYTA